MSKHHHRFQSYLSILFSFSEPLRRNFFKMDVLMFRVYIFMDLTQLRNQGQITLSEVIFDVPTILNDSSLEGTLTLRDLKLTGLETITSDLSNVEAVKIGEPDNFDLCVKIPLQYLNFTTKYVADVGIRNEIPFYGEGNFSIYLSNITINTCMMASYKEYVDKMNFEIDYRHGPIEISGVLKHPEADEFASRLLKIGNVFFAMWNSYEPKKTSCLTSPLVQYFVNWDLNYENRSLEFNQTCLEGSYFDEALGLSEELKWEVLDFLKPHAIIAKDYLMGLKSNVADLVEFLNQIIQL